jgi:leucyl aminopeptidase (aminopeptidase T)
VQRGFVDEISGGAEAELFSEALRLGREQALAMAAEKRIPADKAEEYARNARNLGELGIGLNPAARIVGSMLEDEKAYRTCHVAIGSNYDEDAPALIHFDGLIRAPTIVVELADGSTVVVLKEGDPQTEQP